jgi:uncharacterized protein (UPF0548 family)
VEDQPAAASPSFGFTYGTLPGHLFAGEERFRVWWDRTDDSVWYEVVAYSRPAVPLSRLTYPLLRQIQRKFGPESLIAMRHASTKDQ